jgi:hypothetical protein
MLILNGSSKKSLVLYPPAKPTLVAHQKESLEECPLWVDYEVKYEDFRPVLTIEKALHFQNENEDGTINTFISFPNSSPQSAQQLLVTIINFDNKKSITPETEAELISTTIVHNNISVEIYKDKTLNINPNLSPTQTNQLLQILRAEKESFA